MLGLLGILLGGMAAPMAETEDPSSPISLVAEPVAEGVRIKVIGSAGARYDGTYELEVEGGRNVSRQRGSARLVGGEAVTLSTVTLGTPGQERWRAWLRVRGRDGEAYEQVRTSH